MPEKCRILVEVVLPKGVDAGTFQEYVSDAVKGWNGMFPVDDPLREINDTLKVSNPSKKPVRSYVKKGSQQSVNDSTPPVDPNFQQFIDSINPNDSLTTLR